mmetsp:Transcript_7443/g.16113  ORF Transcript_7443/g.16113 Transcript_7443/m.16113 type:complete len:273 (-) Transcript_7443:881-1699(-)
MSRSGNSRQRSFSPSRRIAPNHRYSTYTPPRQRPVQEDPYSHIGDFQSFPERQSFQRTVSGHQSFQPITVRVVAPENLPEGYRFDVVIHPGRPPVSVKVPSGGVRRGQEISVPLSPNPSNGQPPDGSFDGDNSEIDDSSSSSSADSSEYDLEADNQGRIVGKDRLESESRPPPEGEWRVGICRSFFYKCHEGDMVMICLSVILLPQRKFRKLQPRSLGLISQVKPLMSLSYVHFFVYLTILRIMLRKRNLALNTHLRKFMNSRATQYTTFHY